MNVAADEPTPLTITFTEDAGGPCWSIRWFSGRYVLMAVMALAAAALSASVGWLGGDAMRRIAFLADASDGELLLVLGAFAVIVAYVAAAGLVNRTTVRLGAGQLTVWVGPLPWPGRTSIPVGEIRQIYRQLKVEEMRDRSGFLSWTVSYPLIALLRTGARIKLLETRDAEDVLFLERQIERRLGIGDEAVAGEMVKDGWVPRC